MYFRLHPSALYYLRWRRRQQHQQHQQHQQQQRVRAHLQDRYGARVGRDLGLGHLELEHVPRDVHVAGQRQPVDVRG